MKEYIEIGVAPIYEPCAQVGKDPVERMLAECRVYARQLKRQFPAGIFRVKRFDHDFGVYYEVVAEFSPEDREAMMAAFAAEENPPLYWDQQAKLELIEELSRLGLEVKG
jgi:hypothetical protein